MGKGFNCCDEIIEWIKNNIPKGSTILELGSGKGSTQYLCDDYDLYSIEHEKRWLNKFDSTYIYAPIKDGFYNTDILKKELPEEYALILVDGPPRKIDGKKVGRKGFGENLDLFNTNCVIMFDDSDRGREKKLIASVCEQLGREVVQYKGHDHRGKGTYFAVMVKEEE